MDVAAFLIQTRYLKMRLNRLTDALVWAALALAIIRGFIVGEVLMSIVEPTIVK